MKRELVILVTGVCVAAIACADADDQPQSASANLTSTTKHTTQAKTKASNLPLDHGPRAEVTPWVNQQRRQRAASETPAAAVPASPTSSPQTSPH